MRKLMTKEITVSTIKVAKMEVKDGLPVAVPLPTETVLGHVSMEKAQKDMNKKHGLCTVFELSTETQVYEMEVEEFIKHATLRQPEVETPAKPKK